MLEWFFCFFSQVALWNLSNKDKDCTLWASPAKPLHPESRYSKSVTGLLGWRYGDKTMAIFTGSTDGALRLWQFDKPRQCPRVFCQPAADYYKSQAELTQCYTSVGGEEGKVLLDAPSPKEVGREGGGGGREAWEDVLDPHRPPAGHHHIVTDIIRVDVPQQSMLVSSDASGAVKIWR